MQKELRRGASNVIVNTSPGRRQQIGPRRESIRENASGQDQKMTELNAHKSILKSLDCYQSVLQYRLISAFFKHPQHFQLITLVQKRTLDECYPWATIQLSEDVERYLNQRDASLRKAPSISNDKKNIGSKESNSNNKSLPQCLDPLRAKLAENLVRRKTKIRLRLIHQRESEERAQVSNFSPNFPNN
ncbi:hypothetical protein D915_007580 [Fasciola hepatica]|uniref:Uncharacterized protein n=1 Tax=Fasciola hepatica TaxID=6192 RepID=A0A4E0R144_FASHE|nr:hypothetical protein D915_007580 [Fasciola hepatica]